MQELPPHLPPSERPASLADVDEFLYILDDNECDAGTARDMPPFERAQELVNAGLVFPDVIVDGLIHKGTKGVLTSASKIGKTWILLDLAISVATGGNFLKWKTTQGRVLYINFEIPQPFLVQRLKTVLAYKSQKDLGLLDIRAYS